MLYQVQREGQLYGPYTRQDLERYVASGNVLASDFAKSDEMTGWVPVAELLGGQLAAPPMVAATGWSSYSQEAEFRAPAATLVSEFDWFPVSPVKFVVMSLCTFGIYLIYWTWMQWVREKRRSDASLMPWARTLFSGIWNFALFGQIKSIAEGHEQRVGWNPIVLGVSCWIFTLASRAPGIWAAVSFLAFLPYLAPVITIARRNAEQAAQVAEPLNDRFSAWNYVGIVVGGLLLLLALFGLSLPK